MTSRKGVIAWTLGPAVALAAMTALAQAPGVVRGGADRPVVRKGDGPPQPASATADRRPRGAVTTALLIGLPAIQAELKLSDAQKETIRDLNARFDQRRREAAGRLMKAQGGGLDRAALLAMIAEFRRENEAALARVLDKPQRRRLAQIGLQLEGPMAITRPEIAVRLNLDDTQWLQVQALKEQYEVARTQLYTASDQWFRLRAGAFRPTAGARPGAARPGPRGETAAAESVPGSRGPGAKPQESEGDRLNRASDELRAGLVRELNRALTRRQKTAFNAMLGEPFDLAKVRFRGGQGGAVSLPPDDAPVILEPVPAAAGSKPGR